MISCRKCRGKGTETAFSEQACPDCKGTSTYRPVAVRRRKCRRCRGDGQTEKNNVKRLCGSCEGKGTVTKKYPGPEVPCKRCVNGKIRVKQGKRWCQGCAGQGEVIGNLAYLMAWKIVEEKDEGLGQYMFRRDLSTIRKAIGA